MKIKNLTEGLNTQQSSVPQLPAQAQAQHISVLGAKKDPKHPFAGYAVGASESAARRAQPRHYDEGAAEGLSPQQKQAHQANLDAAQREMDSREAEGEDMTGAKIDQKTYEIIKPKSSGVTEAATDERESGNLKESGYRGAYSSKDQAIDYAKSVIKSFKGSVDGIELWQLPGGTFDLVHTMNSSERMRIMDKDGRKVGTIRPNKPGVSEAERNEMDTPAVQAALKKMAERHRGEKWTKEQLAALGKRIAAHGQKKKGVEETNFAQAGEVIGGIVGGVGGMALSKGKKSGYAAGTVAGSAAGNAAGRWIDRKLEPKIGKDQVGATKAVTRYQKPVAVEESVTKEDIITKLKARLGDYLSDISKEIKKDPDLVDKLAARVPGDQMGPPVKTVTTDDGHQIQIHGNEDDGFRISIKNKQAPSRFNNLDEAVMACEMYCARRRKQALNADYVEEA